MRPYDVGAAGESAAVERPRVEVRGKFLWSGATKFFMRGVSYGPFQPDAMGSPFPSAEQINQDMALLGLAMRQANDSRANDLVKQLEASIQSDQATIYSAQIQLDYSRIRRVHPGQHGHVHAHQVAQQHRRQHALEAALAGGVHLEGGRADALTAHGIDEDDVRAPLRTTASRRRTSPTRR